MSQSDTSHSLIDALLSQDCYPHDSHDITLIETHISWVLLTGDYVYKIKKPVDFTFLDFSSLDKRRHYCEEELRLNRRFSAGLYIEVVRITGTIDAPHINGQGPLLEYAVKMRQFDQSGLLDKLAHQQQLTLEDMISLGQKLAAFHATGAQPLVPASLAADDPLQGYGSPEEVLEDALGNFTEMRQHMPSDKNAAEQLERLEQWTRATFSELEAIIKRRHSEGFVRECHGDLHLGNIARIDGEITFFDCIEFNPVLRWIDIQSELAFLLMDLEEKGLHGLANRALNRYLEFSGDYAGLVLLPFFKIYRALVRAKVDILKLANEDLPENKARAVSDACRHYLTLAEDYCRTATPCLILMHGVSGSGKSTVADRLATVSGAIRLRSDVERKRLFGLAPDARSSEAQQAVLYTAEASTTTFERLQALTRKLITTGQSVIVDATFLERKRRSPYQELAKELDIQFMIVDCVAPESELTRRLETREQSGRGASDAGVEVMRRQLEFMQPFVDDERDHVVTVDTQLPLNDEVLQQLQAKVSPRGERRPRSPAHIDAN